LEPLLNSPHKLSIGLLLNNPNIRVWAAVVPVVPAEADCAGRWIPDLNPAVAVVGFEHMVAAAE
jgi:hypothetical protein